jgi:CDP-paratose 2-epimerase
MRYLVTGGAGFIGSNYVSRLLARGEEVVVYDNLARPGTTANLAWLRAGHGDRSFRFVRGDVRDADHLLTEARATDVILHLAAQVAVTTSVEDPRTDFEVNALGTFNVLEAARRSPRQPVVVYASTNKVYGALDDAGVVEDPSRYRLAGHPLGVGEEQPLDFHSPYGCSKGCGDQYVRDYHRIYGLPTVVLRQSCIYGPRQLGCEDQGWVAWFVIAAVTGRPVTVYGDGKQVRDLLHVDDLCRAYDRAVERIEATAGRVYNLGGGPLHTLSVWRELGPLLARLLGREVPVSFGPWRAGDQRVYVSDLRRASSELGWSPTISVTEGVASLVEWVSANRILFNGLQ